MYTGEKPVRRSICPRLCRFIGARSCINRRRLPSVPRCRRLMTNELEYRSAAGAELRPRRAALAALGCRAVKIAGAIHDQCALGVLSIPTALESVQRCLPETP